MTATRRWPYVWIGVLLLLPAVAGGQDGRSADVNALRQKIADLEKKLQAQTEKESRTEELVETLDRKISLTKNLLARLERETASERATLDSLQQLRADYAQKLETLKKQIANRMVDLYKYGRLSNLEALLHVSSIRYLQLWIDYQKRQNRLDAVRILSYRQKQERLARVQQQIESHLAEQVKLLEAKQLEERELQKDRRRKQKLLKKLRRDRHLYERQLQNYQRAMEEIQRLIADSEARRNATPESAVTPDQIDFAAMKGRLPWPVEGEVLRAYGPYKHPVLKTVTNNLGIDIAVPLGTPVRAVAPGRVTAITWQRGRGNLVIVNHGGGYYTVYTHLNEIFVNLQEPVAGGEVIGRVGETGTLERPVLHFQVWHGFDHMDPEEWLQSR